MYIDYERIKTDILLTTENPMDPANNQQEDEGQHCTQKRYEGDWIDRDPGTPPFY